MYGLLRRWLLKEHPFGAVISPTLPTYFIIKIILEKIRLLILLNQLKDLLPLVPTLC